MMPAALISPKSQSSGHGCFPPQQAQSGSSTIFINGYAAQRLGDKYAIHTCVSSHDGQLSSGSQKTNWDGKPAGRVGDTISCGGTGATGSSDTNID